LDPDPDTDPQKIIPDPQAWLQKKLIISSQENDPECSTRILDPGPGLFSILDGSGSQIQGSKNHQIPDASAKMNPALKNIISFFFLFLWVIFVLLDPDQQLKLI
jgi:hypothetical protein